MYKLLPRKELSLNQKLKLSNPYTFALHCINLTEFKEISLKKFNVFVLKTKDNHRSLVYKISNFYKKYATLKSARWQGKYFKL